jgi:hypothetical protein
LNLTSRVAEYDNIMVINLTQAFGAGNEPSLADIREMVANGNGY